MRMPLFRNRRRLFLVLVVSVACGGTAPTEPGVSYASNATRTVNQSTGSGELALPHRSDAIEAFTGGRTRAVWVRDLGDGTDILGFGDQLLLMGLDTFDDVGERALIDTPGAYAKPLITPRGDRVIYADRSDNSVRIVSWNDRTVRRLADGFPLAVWIDFDADVEWVYVGTDARGTDPESYGAIHRHPIDQPDRRELVWNKRAVSGDSFQVSRDGRLAGALARWPDAGVMDLPNGEWRQLGEGCWTSLAGDGSGLFWYFDGQHRNLTIVDTHAEVDRRWTVNISSAPGINGFEVYHPRWSNHARYFTMTGPYTVGGGGNKIRGGGHGVEIHIGRFAADHSRVEAWMQVTVNDGADFYPDIWVDPVATVPMSGVSMPASADTDSAAPIAASSVTVRARVSADVPLPTPLDIAPYRNGLLVLEYEVLEVLDGNYQSSQILAAHWVIRNSEVLPGAERPSGTIVQMALDPYAAHPELEGERLVMDSDRFDLSLYYDTGSNP